MDSVLFGDIRTNMPFVVDIDTVSAAVTGGISDVPLSDWLSGMAVHAGRGSAADDSAVAVGSGSTARYYNSVQLGPGSTSNGGFGVRNFNVLDGLGKIPSERYPDGISRTASEKIETVSGYVRDALISSDIYAYRMRYRGIWRNDALYKNGDVVSFLSGMELYRNSEHVFCGGNEWREIGNNHTVYYVKGAQFISSDGLAEDCLISESKILDYPSLCSEFRDVKNAFVSVSSDALLSSDRDIFNGCGTLREEQITDGSVKSIRLGDTDLRKIYQGDRLIWQRSSYDGIFNLKAVNGSARISLQKRNETENYPNLTYTRDVKSSWTPFNIGDYYDIPENECFYIRSALDYENSDVFSGYCFVFDGDGQIEARGNIQYLIDRDGQSLSVKIGCYADLFYGCDRLVKAPELPAVVLADTCYTNMFANCTGLGEAPDLPASVLAAECYSAMFINCASLVEPPVISAGTLANSCCQMMFSGCTSLTKAPALPAEKLAVNCYCNMFYDCSSLINAPDLPASVLAEGCYASMFFDCKSLVQAPVLSAVSLADMCYYGMFYGCTSLKKAPVLPAETLAVGCYGEMFYGCNKLWIAQNISSTGYLIFDATDPNTGTYCYWMFEQTRGSFHTTPTAGNKYYCYS